MELGTKINALAEYFAELVRKSEIIQSYALESPGLELCQDINIASVRFEAAAHRGTEERERANPPLGTKARDPFAIDLDGQVSGFH